MAIRIKSPQQTTAILDLGAVSQIPHTSPLLERSPFLFFVIREEEMAVWISINRYMAEPLRKLIMISSDSEYLKLVIGSVVAVMIYKRLI
jgi:hypothetical protein